MFRCLRYGSLITSLCVIALYVVLLRSKATGITAATFSNESIPRVHLAPARQSKEDDMEKSVRNFYKQALLKIKPTESAVLKLDTTIHILLGLLYIGQQPIIAAGAKDTIAWILLHSSVPVHFHILTDKESQPAIENIFRRAGEQALCNYTFRVEFLGQTYQDLLKVISKHFPTITVPVIQEALITQMLPLILPWHYNDLDRIIFLNPKLKFRTDIAHLYAHFDRFDKDHVMALALNQNAKFLQQFEVYRLINNVGPRLGLLEPEGWPGFDTNLILLDLKKMRTSKRFIELANLEQQFHLIKKYEFPTKENMPNLEEWLTIMGAEVRSLFYTLPCEWNIQKKGTHLDNHYKTCSGLPKAMQV